MRSSQVDWFTYHCKECKQETVHKIHTKAEEGIVTETRTCMKCDLKGVKTFDGSITV